MALREGRKDLAFAIALLAFAVAAVQLASATFGGIVRPLALTWGVTLASLAGAGLALRASRRGPWWLAWPAALLLWLPVAVTPLALSWTGVGVVALLALLTGGLLWQTVTGAAAR